MALTRVPSIRQAIGACFLFYAIFIPINLVMHFAAPRLDSSLAFLVEQFATWAIFITILLRWSKAPARTVFPFTPVPTRGALPVVVWSLSASVVLASLAGLIPGSELFQKLLEDLTSSVPIFLLAVVIVAPLAEEVVFRGWMLRGFVSHYGERKAIILTAIFFGVFHLNPWQGVIAIPLGVVYAWIALRTRSLIPSIISHSLVNATSLILTPALSLLGYDSEDISELAIYPWQILVPAVVLLGITSVVFWRIIRSWPTPAAIDIDPQRKAAGPSGPDG